MARAATTGPTRRDFRLVVCFDLPRCFQPGEKEENRRGCFFLSKRGKVVWLPKKLTPTNSGGTTFVAQQSAPAEGN